MRLSESTDPVHAAVQERLRRGLGVDQPLPGGGVLHIDRPLPYLLVYRGGASDPEARLVRSESCYLLAGSEAGGNAAELVRRIAEEGRRAHGSFLVLELWTAPDPGSTVFRVHAPPRIAEETTHALTTGLRPLRDVDPRIEVRLETGDVRHPAELEPLLSVHESWQSGVLLLGLEVPPLFRDPETGGLYPRLLARLRRRLSPVLRRALYEFIRVQTRHDLVHYHALGTHRVPPGVLAADRALSDLEASFDFLLLTSPINEAREWQATRANRDNREPEFLYRLLPVDPDQLKRRLYDVRLEEIDDPALAEVFQEKRAELDTQLTMLGERNEPGFRFSSMRLYGTVTPSLLRTAHGLLDDPGLAPAGRRRARRFDAAGFRAAAAAELARYRRARPTIANRIIIRPDIVGLLVSDGDLFIGESLSIAEGRVEALVQHEVGTHMLTHINGRAQPFRQLSLGLAGYDELQEGLAVLAEYLVGGLTAGRMRLLAARVIAAHAVEQGATFTETLRLLTREHSLGGETAWYVSARVHACGGFTRDLIYLRGLADLLEYLRGAGELEPLYAGKIARKHIPLVEELLHRGVLRPPVLLPRHLSDPDAAARLGALRSGLPLSRMIRTAP
jgi:uncharacterized protein (TIGR02421 family)